MSGDARDSVRGELPLGRAALLAIHRSLRFANRLKQGGRVQLQFDVLLIESSPADVLRVEEMLAQPGADRYSLKTAERLSGGLEQLATGKFDAVLLDLMLPDTQGLRTVQEALRFALDVPLIIFSGADHEALAYQALSAGAQDYLVKDAIDGPSLRRAIRHSVARHSLQSTVHDLALIDHLTGLNNRRGFFHLSEQHLRLTMRSGKSLSVVVVDLDRLKNINDSFGHLEGNRALIETAGMLRRSFRQSDIVGRLGGDEFAVLVVDNEVSSVQWVMNRLLREQESCNRKGERPYQISLSVGMVHCQVAPFPPLEELIAQADTEMYRQKKLKDLSFPLRTAAKEKSPGSTYPPD